MQVDSLTGETAGCTDKGLGQEYVRWEAFEGYCAIMYMWYFPKDVASTSGKTFGTIGGFFDEGASASLGHRHDFESVIVWATSCDVGDSEIFGVSYSGHGGYHSHLFTDKASDPDLILVEGNYHPEATYDYHKDSIRDITHRLDEDGVSDGIEGSTRAPTTMIMWKELPEPAVTALEDGDWSSAGCLMCDQKFSEQLHRAWWGYENSGDSGLSSML